MAGYLILGSDTGVGKTRVTSTLLRALRARGVNAAGYKPFASGDRADALALMDAAHMEGWTVDQVNPVFFLPPMAPYAACIIEDRRLDWDAADAGFQLISSKSEVFLVESAGGLMTPLTREETMLDLAARWNLPCILVVPNRLGVLSQSLCCTTCLKAAGARLTAVVLNNFGETDPALAQSNYAILEERLGGGVFAADPSSLARLAESLL